MDLKQLTLKLVRLLLGNIWNRTGSALALIGATALTGWIDQAVAHLLGFKLEQTATWIGLAVMLLGVAMLGYGVGQETTPPPNPHDAALIAQFRALVSNHVLDFLANHDFGTPWRRDRLDAIAEIAESWHAARFEFVDTELNAALTKVKVSANNLEERLAYGTYPMRNNAEMQTAKTDEDYRIGTQPATIEKIDEINHSAAALLADINSLERLARKKIPV